MIEVSAVALIAFGVSCFSLGFIIGTFFLLWVTR